LRVGGSPTSQHQLGLAVDLVVPVSRRAAVASRLRGAGVVVIDEGDHLHVQHSSRGVWDRTITRAAQLGLI
jgi:hypothetical protein